MAMKTVDIEDPKQATKQLGRLMEDVKAGRIAEHLAEMRTIYLRWKNGNQIEDISNQAVYRFNLYNLRDYLQEYDKKHETNYREQVFGKIGITAVVPMPMHGIDTSIETASDIQYLINFPRIPEGVAGLPQEADIRVYPRWESVISQGVTKRVLPLISRGAAAEASNDMARAADYGRQILEIFNKGGIDNATLKQALGMTAAQTQQWKEAIAQGRYIDSININQQSAWTRGVLEGGLANAIASGSRQENQVVVVLNGEKEWDIGDTPLAIRGDVSLWPVRVRKIQPELVTREGGEYGVQLNETKKTDMGAEVGGALVRKFGRYKEVNLRLALERLPKALVDLNKPNLVGKIVVEGIEYSGGTTKIGEIPIYISGKVGVDIIHGKQAGTVGSVSVEPTVGVGFEIIDGIPMMFAINLKWWANLSPDLQRTPLVIRAGPRAQFKAGKRVVNALVYFKTGIPGAAIRGEAPEPFRKGGEVGFGATVEVAKHMGMIRTAGLGVEATRTNIDFQSGIESAEKNPWQVAAFLEFKF